MDQRRQLLNMMRGEFGNLLNTARIKIVTIDSVDLANMKATVAFATPDPTLADPPDKQTVRFFNGYHPVVGDLAYYMITEGAPVLLGRVDLETWHALTLPTGYSVVAGWTAPGYRIDNGQVRFRGACNVAASNAAGTKFTLPVGYRPGQSRALAVPYSNGTSISDHLRYNIDSAGVMSTALVTPAATVFMMFEGVSFDVRSA